MPSPSFCKNKNLKIETPNGFENFYGIQKIHRNKYIELTFSNGESLICSLDHPIATIDGKIKAKELDKKTEVIGRYENTFLIKRRTIKKKIELFDIVNAGSKHQYYANNIVSFNCDFIGSQSTLISAEKLTALVAKDPLESNNNLFVYAKPDPTRRYMITVDVAEGVELDFSIATVIDITEIPYTIAAIYKSNTTAPMVLPNIIYKIATEYNKAFVLIELNAYGSQVADILFYDLEYSNLLMCAMVGRSGLVLGQGFSRKCKFGLAITKSTKRLGCSNLKSLIENDKLIIHDFGMISELHTYIAKGDSYAADECSNDDLVATLVVFAWCVTQPYFKELTDLDTRESIYEVKRQEQEEELKLFGFLMMGNKDFDQPAEEIDNDGILWKTVDDEIFEYGSVVTFMEFF